MASSGPTATPLLTEPQIEVIVQRYERVFFTVALRMLGNAVVPQQAALALRMLA